MLELLQGCRICLRLKVVRFSELCKVAKEGLPSGHDRPFADGRPIRQGSPKRSLRNGAACDSSQPHSVPSGRVQHMSGSEADIQLMANAGITLCCRRSAVSPPCQIAGAQRMAVPTISQKRAVTSWVLPGGFDRAKRERFLQRRCEPRSSWRFLPSMQDGGCQACFLNRSDESMGKRKD